MKHTAMMRVRFWDHLISFGCVVTLAGPWVAAQRVEAAPKWREIGPKPIKSGYTGGSTGRVSGVAAHPTDKDVFFISTAGGGAWRYDKGTWTPLTDRLSMLATGAIAVDPNNPDILFVGGGEANFAPHCFYGAGIFKSTDGGKSWKNVGKKVSAGRTVSKIAIAKQKSDVIFAAVQRAGGIPNNDSAHHHPQKDDPMGIYRSQDGGESWARLKGLPEDAGATDVVIAPDDPSLVYVAYGDRRSRPSHGVYRSRDGGDSWEKLKLPQLSKELGRISLAISPSQPKDLFVLAAAGTPDNNPRKSKVLGLWHSKDQGDSFVKHNPGDVASGFGWFMLVVGVNPKDSKHVVVGGMNLVGSTNGGQRFSDITPPHVDIHAIVWDAAGRLLVGDDGGVHRSSSKGRNWETLNKGLGTMQFYPSIALHPTNPNWILGGLQDNGTVRWDGKSWHMVIGGDGGYAALHPKRPNVVLGQSQHTGNLMRSTNGGSSFSRSSSGIVRSDRDAFFNPVIFDPNDPDTAYYATQRLYRSTNSGKSWSAISMDLTDGAFLSAIRSIDVAKSDSKVIYVVTTDGRVLVSSDGGKNFEVKLQDISDWKRVSRDLVISDRSADVAYLGIPKFASAMGRVLKTSDRGKSWQDIAGNLPENPVNSMDLYTDPNGSAEDDILFLGTDNDVYISCNDGERWVSIGKGRARAIATEVRYQAEHKRVVVSTMGRGIWLFEDATPEALRELCEADPGDNGDSGEGDTGDGEGGDTGGDEDSGGEGGNGDGGSGGKDSTGGTSEGKGDSGNEDSAEHPEKTGAAEDSDEGDSDAESGGEPSAEDEGGGAGCGCRAASGWGWSSMLGLVGLLGLRRRRVGQG